MLILIFRPGSLLNNSDLSFTNLILQDATAATGGGRYIDQQAARAAPTGSCKCRIPWPAVMLMVGALGLATPHAMAQHETDVWVGAAGGRLVFEPYGQPNHGLRPGSLYNQLDRTDFLFHGWSANDPGFDHVVTTLGGVTPLPLASAVWLEVVSLDPGFYALDNSFQFLESPGDSTYLGSLHEFPSLHMHITWVIDEDDPGFDPDQCVWEATFKLTDEGGSLADSEPFTFLFSNVPVRGGEFDSTTTPPADGDFDKNGVVDSDDTEALGVCMNGPQVRPAPADPEVTLCEVECHNAFDFDDDLDVDLRDVAEYQAHYGG